MTSSHLTNAEKFGRQWKVCIIIDSAPGKYSNVDHPDLG